MRRFVFAGLLAFTALICAVALGSTPERRYESAACQYRMIHDYTPEQGFGLVTVGGSRMRVATSAREFNPLLAEKVPQAAPMHNLSHSYFTLEKEYVLIDELLRKHGAKSVLVMIEPRQADFGKAHPDFLEIARLQDIPLTMKALWSEDPHAAFSAAKAVVFQHLRFIDRVGKPHKEMTLFDCDRLDYRLDVRALDAANKKYISGPLGTLNWSLDDPDQHGLAVWLNAYKELAEKYDTEIMFMLITATPEPLPDPALEAKFLEKFDMPLITLDPELHAVLSEGGKRDASHINQQGRAVLLPWLIDEIAAKCRREDGCF